MKTMATSGALLALLLAAPAFAAAAAAPAASPGAHTSPVPANIMTPTQTPTTTGTGTSAAAGSATHANWHRARWEHERDYWRHHFQQQAYANNTNGYGYNQYEPAYQYGVSLYNQYQGQPWETLNQQQVAAGWQQVNPNVGNAGNAVNAANPTTGLTWAQAQVASKDAYARLYNAGAIAGSNAVTPPAPIQANTVVPAGSAAATTAVVVPSTSSNSSQIVRANSPAATTAVVVAPATATPQYNAIAPAR